MRRLSILTTTALFLSAAPYAYAQDEAVDVAKVRADATFLADDLLQGREAGTPGYDIAANYVASRMLAMGIAPGDADGDYMQDITYLDWKSGEDSVIRLGDTAFGIDSSFLFQNATGAPLEGSADLVFVGLGVSDPAIGLDFIGDTDLTDKIAVAIFSPSIPGAPADVGSHLVFHLPKALAARGAKGLIYYFPPGAVPAEFHGEIREFLVDLHSAQPAVEGELAYDLTPPLALYGSVLDDASEALFANATMSVDQYMQSMMSGTMVPAYSLGKTATYDLKGELVETYRTSNVVGMIEGSDPELRDELIVLTAHLDHVGIDEDAAPGEDNIFNGLFDNAMGVSAMLEAARLFTVSGEAPRRSIAFVALGAEEKGLKGSEWLAAHPERFPGKTMVGVVNLDMPVTPDDFDRVVAYGGEHSTISAQIDTALSALGVVQIEDPSPEEAYFVRSDHYSFVKAGIPSVMLEPIPVEASKPLYDEFQEKHYHKVSDQIGLPLDWEAAGKFALVNYLIARQMADADEAPRWYDDSYFGNAFAPDAAKASR